MRWCYFIFLLMLPLLLGAQEVTEDTLVHMNKVQRLKQRAVERIHEKMNEPYDTIHDSGYWWRALKHGHVDFTGETIHYPKFIRFCWRTYMWGDKTFNSYDTSYVVSTGKNWKLMFKSNNWNDTYRGEPTVNDIQIDLRSKLTANVGLQLSFMAVSVGYTLGITNLINGEKVSKKLDFSFTCARFAADAYYMENSSTSTARVTDKGTGGKWTIKDFGGLHRKSYGLSAYYFFNNRRYAQAAAYCFSKYQKRSAGSWLAGFCLQHRDMSIAMDELPQFVLDNIPSDGYGEVPHFLYNDYCLLVGYGHNWVLSRKWLLNLTVTPYVGYRHLIATSNEDRASAWSLNLRARMGAVYNHKQYFVGLQSFGDFHRYKSQKHHFIGSLLDFNALVGIRF